MSIYAKVLTMQESTDLTYMASIYMAMADKTRLRLLDLMRNGEICVGSFTDMLGESQPKISRQLAYLRNAGIVDARRDGKWIHYSIHWPDDPGGRGLLRAALDWVAGSNEPELTKKRTGPTTSSQDDIIYAEPYINKSDISLNEYEAHNELDDFLL